MSTPAFQAAGAIAASTGATISPAWPTHQTGDIALLIVETPGGEPPSLTTPAGFAAVTNSPIATGSGAAGTQLSIWWCRATSSSMSAPTTTKFSGGNHQVGVILTFRGCVAIGNPIDVTATGTDASNTTSLSWPSITTTRANELVLCIVSQDLDANEPSGWVSSEANAALTGVAENFDEGDTTGNGGGIALWTGVKVAAGSVGNGTATAGTTGIHAYMTLALFGETTPTIALDTADASTVTGSQPTLEFHGTDSEGQDCTYRIHVDNALDRCSDEFGTLGAAVSLQQAATVGAGQSFTPATSGLLSAVSVFLAKIASPTGNVTVSIYAHDGGTYGSTGKPTGAALATSDPVDASTLTGSAVLTAFTFSNPPTLTSGTHYFLVVEYSATGGSNFVSVYGFSPSQHGGNAVIWNGSAFTAIATTDLAFYAWGPGPRVLLQKLSAVDTAQFVDHTNGADTDPFASGDHIYWTPVAADALPGGTYTWFALVKDPSGSNVWSAAPTYQTFTVPTVTAAAVSVAAYDAKALISPNAGAAAVSATAYDTTTIIPSLRTPTPDPAAVSVTAYDAKVLIKPNAGAAAIGATANDAQAVVPPIGRALEYDTALSITPIKSWTAEVSLTSPASDDVVVAVQITASKTEAADAGEIRFSVEDGSTILQTTGWVTLTTTPTVIPMVLAPFQYVADLRILWEVRTSSFVEVIVTDVSALAMSVAAPASVSVTALNPSAAVRPNVGAAAVSVVAFDATALVRPNAGAAAVSAVAYDPARDVKVNAVPAAVSVVADNARAVHVAPATDGAVSVQAFDATCRIRPNAGAAAVSVTANPPTSRQSARAVPATVAVTADYPTTLVDVEAVGAAAVSVAAQPPTARAGTMATLASVSVLASDATTTAVSTAGSAAVSVTAFDATCRISPNAGSGSVAATSSDATISIGAAAGLATVSVDAFEADVVGSTNVNAPATDAAVSVTAFDASCSIAPNARSATVTASAFAATVGARPSASVATVSVDAFDPLSSVGARPAAAVVVVSGYDGITTVPGTVVPAPAEAGTVAVVAFDATVQVVANAGSATVAVTAYTLIDVPSLEGRPVTARESSVHATLREQETRVDATMRAREDAVRVSLRES